MNNLYFFSKFDESMSSVSFEEPEVAVFTKVFGSRNWCVVPLCINGNAGQSVAFQRALHMSDMDMHTEVVTLQS